MFSSTGNNTCKDRYALRNVGTALEWLMSVNNERRAHGAVKDGCEQWLASFDRIKKKGEAVELPQTSRSVSSDLGVDHITHSWNRFRMYRRHPVAELTRRSLFCSVTFKTSGSAT